MNKKWISICCDSGIIIEGKEILTYTCNKCKYPCGIHYISRKSIKSKLANNYTLKQYGMADYNNPDHWDAIKKGRVFEYVEMFVPKNKQDKALLHLLDLVDGVLEMYKVKGD